MRRSRGAATAGASAAVGASAALHKWSWRGATEALEAAPARRVRAREHRQPGRPGAFAQSARPPQVWSAAGLSESSLVIGTIEYSRRGFGRRVRAGCAARSHDPPRRRRRSGAGPPIMVGGQPECARGARRVARMLSSGRSERTPTRITRSDSVRPRSESERVIRARIPAVTQIPAIRPEGPGQAQNTTRRCPVRPVSHWAATAALRGWPARAARDLGSCITWHQWVRD